MHGALEILSGFAAKLWAPFDERVNPILVKEVRQSLRGRYFMVLFLLTLSAATLVSSILLFFAGREPSDVAGIYLFTAMLYCLSVAVHIFVPLAAFLSLGGEWDENTHDLLVLTNLRPGQIVVGKLLSAGVQVSLYYCVFGPFLIFAFLLRGLDLVVAGWALASMLCTSLALISLALALSSITSIKIIRYFLLAVAAVAFVTGAVNLPMPWAVLLWTPGEIHDPAFLPVIIGILLGVVTIAAFAIAFATARLAHPEENRSTSLRILTTIVVLVGIGWAYWLYGEIGYHEVLLIATAILGGILAFMSTFFITERESLGRRVRLQVPRSTLLGLLAAPWLPGGGRGILFLLLHFALVLGAMLGAPHLLSGGITAEIAAWRPMSLAIVLYLFIYVALPTVFFAPLTGKILWRVVARLVVPVFVFATVFVPFMVGFFFDIDDLLDGEFASNPGYLIWRAVDGDGITGTVVFLAVAAVIVLGLNLFRVNRALLENASASAYRSRLASSALVREDPAGGGDARADS